MAITNLTVPIISGTPRSGQVLTTSDGTWTSDDPLSFDYQWMRCDANGANCVEINNANSSNYLLTPSDIGSRIKIRINATEVPFSGGGSLMYTPPGYPSYAGYQTVNLNGASGWTGDDNTDYKINIGNFSYPEGIALVGGRKVVIIGGHITATGSGRAVGVGLAIWPRTANSHYYIEGLRIKPSKSGSTWNRTMNDGIAVRGTLGTITIQNCLVGPVAIKQGFNSSQAHADVLQIQNNFDGHLRVNQFTGYTEYTGIMESAFLVREQDWTNVNLVATGYSANDLDPLTLGSGYRGHTAFGIYDAGLTHTLPGVSFTNCWWAKDPLQGFAGFSPTSIGSQWNSGKPGGSDIVTEAMVAYPYTSPGYL